MGWPWARVNLPRTLLVQRGRVVWAISGDEEQEVLGRIQQLEGLQAEQLADEVRWRLAESTGSIPGGCCWLVKRFHPKMNSDDEIGVDRVSHEEKPIREEIEQHRRDEDALQQRSGLSAANFWKVSMPATTADLQDLIRSLAKAPENTVLARPC